MFQIQENLGNGDSIEEFRLWDVTPFDISVMDGACAC